MPFQDLLYAVCVRAYSDHDSRIAVSELKIIRRSKELVIPHFNSITNFLNREETTKLLKVLIIISALPLREVESYFAIDSSGFTTYSSSFWLEFRHGVNIASKRTLFTKVWKKLHLLTGTQTNVIANVEVTTRFVGDSTMFSPMFENATKFFDMKEITADKAYSSRAIIDQIMENGTKPYIPFRSNSTGKTRGGVYWKRIYREFRTNRKDFMEHYHRRSNAEATFAMLKRKLRERIRAKNERGMINELLAKCLCHNLKILIQEMHELKLKIDFEEANQFYKKGGRKPKNGTLADYC